MILKKKVTYIISNVDKALAFEWIAEHINREKIELNFIFITSQFSETAKVISTQNTNVKTINYKSKKDLFTTFLQLLKELRKNKPDVIHCHLFEASLTGLLAGKLLGIKKRIYTRHHSTYHHVYFPNAIKYDKFINFLATKIIAISSVVKAVLIEKENVSPDKIVLIHHGFKLDEFINISSDRILVLKSKFEIHSNYYPVIGVVSRYTEWKGIQYIIPAFSEIIKKYPNALLVLCNAKGNYKDKIKELLTSIPAKNYREIPFENDIFALYQLFDIFVHVPIDEYSEAFGQIYVEALSAKIPSIFTISGIANDFIVNKKNSIVVNFKKSMEIVGAVEFYLTNPEEKQRIVEQGVIDVKEKFYLQMMIEKLEKLYEQ